MRKKERDEERVCAYFFKCFVHNSCYCCYYIKKVFQINDSKFSLQIHDDQNITGTIKIQGNVYAYSDFNAHSINDFKPSQIISINTDDILFGKKLQRII